MKVVFRINFKPKRFASQTWCRLCKSGNACTVRMVRLRRALFPALVPVWHCDILRTAGEIPKPSFRSGADEAGGESDTSSRGDGRSRTRPFVTTRRGLLAALYTTNLYVTVGLPVGADAVACLTPSSLYVESAKLFGTGVSCLALDFSGVSSACPASPSLALRLIPLNPHAAPPFPRRQSPVLCARLEAGPCGRRSPEPRQPQCSAKTLVRSRSPEGALARPSNRSHGWEAA